MSGARTSGARLFFEARRTGQRAARPSNTLSNNAMQLSLKRLNSATARRAPAAGVSVAVRRMPVRCEFRSPSRDDHTEWKGDRLVLYTAPDPVHGGISAERCACVGWCSNGGSSARRG